MAMTTDCALPWYREPWPWLLMAGPVIVIIAGMATLWLAVSSSDGLVVDDYYKQGMAINQTLQRDALAARRSYRAEARFAADGPGVTVQMGAADGEVLPDTLQLRIVHPTRAGHDGLVLLRHRGNGRYEGVRPSLSEGRWQLLLEDQPAAWRLTGAVTVPVQAPAALLPAADGGK